MVVQGNDVDADVIADVASFSIVGATSGATLSSASTASFDHSKSIALNAKAASAEAASAVEAVATKPTSATFEIAPSEDTALQFASCDKAEANVTLVTAGVLPKFEVSGSPSVGAVYVGDELKINLPKAKAGFAYKAVVTDKDGGAVNPDDDGIYVVPGSITVTIAKEVATTVTFTYKVTNEILTITYAINGEAKTAKINDDNNHNGTSGSLEADAGSMITLKSNWGDSYSINGGASTHVDDNKEFTIVADADISFVIGSYSDD